MSFRSRQTDKLITMACNDVPDGRHQGGQAGVGEQGERRIGRVAELYHSNPGEVHRDVEVENDVGGEPQNVSGPKG